MTNRREGGSSLEPGDRPARQSVDELLAAVRTDPAPSAAARRRSGRRTPASLSRRKFIQLAVPISLLIIVSVLGVRQLLHPDSVRRQAVDQALERLNSRGEVTQYLGTPVAVHGAVTGQATRDAAGWHEVRLTLPVRGPAAEGVAHLVASRPTGPWRFTTLSVIVPSARKRVDLVTGEVAHHDPAAGPPPEAAGTTVPPPRRDGRYPCLFTLAVAGSEPRVGDCPEQLPLVTFAAGPVDRFDVDLRYGKFVLRQTDLLLQDGDLQVPLTRTYSSQFWAHGAKVNAFGVHSTHAFDIAPVGNRNPFTYLMIVLPDNDFLYFPRISMGTGYADAVFQHSETASTFYKAILRWDGAGWDTRLADGSRIHFPESYAARNMAQGGPTEMTDSGGRRVRLIRDSQRNLEEIRTPNGRWIKFGFDEEARVVRAWEDGGRSVEYRYHATGRWRRRGIPMGARAGTPTPARS